MIRPLIRKAAFKLGVCAYRRKSTMEAYQAAAKWISPRGKKHISNYREGKITGLLNHMVMRKKIGNEAVFLSEFTARLNNIRGYVDITEQRYIEYKIYSLSTKKIDMQTGDLVKNICEFAEMLRRSGAGKTQLQLIYDEAVRASRLIRGKDERETAFANTASEMVKAKLSPPIPYLM